MTDTTNTALTRAERATRRLLQREPDLAFVDHYASAPSSPNDAAFSDPGSPARSSDASPSSDALPSSDSSDSLDSSDDEGAPFHTLGPVMMVAYRDKKVPTVTVPECAELDHPRPDPVVVVSWLRSCEAVLTLNQAHRAFWATIVLTSLKSPLLAEWRAQLIMDFGAAHPTPLGKKRPLPFMSWEHFTRALHRFLQLPTGDTVFAQALGGITLSSSTGDFVDTCRRRTAAIEAMTSLNAESRRVFLWSGFLGDALAAILKLYPRAEHYSYEKLKRSLLKMGAHCHAPSVKRPAQFSDPAEEPAVKTARRTREPPLCTVCRDGRHLHKDCPLIQQARDLRSKK